MVLGVGLRPCSGALVVLVFALSQGIFYQGIAAVFLMRGSARRSPSRYWRRLPSAPRDLRRVISARDGVVAQRVVWWAELDRRRYRASCSAPRCCWPLI